MTYSDSLLDWFDKFSQREGNGLGHRLVREITLANQEMGRSKSQTIKDLLEALQSKVNMFEERNAQMIIERMNQP